MDADQKLVAFLETLGDDADVEFARQVLAAHDWDLQAALDTVVAGGTEHSSNPGGAAGFGGDPPVGHDPGAMDEEGYRAPMRTGYTDQLIGPDPAELAFEQAHAMAAAARAQERAERRARREAQRAARSDSGITGAAGGVSRRDGRPSSGDGSEVSSANAERAVFEQSAAEYRRLRDRREQEAIAQALQASYQHRQEQEVRHMAANAEAEREEQQQLARAIEASYREQSVADAAYRNAMEQVTRASQDPVSEFAGGDAANVDVGPRASMTAAHVGESVPRPGSSGAASFTGAPATAAGRRSPASAGGPVAVPAVPERLSSGSRPVGVGGLGSSAAPRGVNSTGRRAAAPDMASPASLTSATSSTSRPSGARVPSGTSSTSAGSRHARVNAPPNVGGTANTAAPVASASSRAAIDRAAVGGARAAIGVPSQQPFPGTQHRMQRDAAAANANRYSPQAYPSNGMARSSQPIGGGSCASGAAAPSTKGGSCSSSAGARPGVGPESMSQAQHARPPGPMSASSSPTFAGGGARGSTPPSLQFASEGAVADPSSSSRAAAATRQRDAAFSRPNPLTAGRASASALVDSGSGAGSAAAIGVGGAPGQRVAAREAAEADHRRRHAEEAEKEAKRRAEAAAAAVAREADHRRRQAEEAEKEAKRRAEAAAVAAAQEAERKREREEAARKAAAEAENEQRRRAQAAAEESRRRDAQEAEDARRKAAEAEVRRQEAERAAQQAAIEESRRREAQEAEDLRREAAEAEIRRQEAERAQQERDSMDELAPALVAMRKRYKEDPQGLATCLSTLKAYIGNLAKNPQELKFQKINLDNGAFRSRVAPFEGAVAVLKACGFEEEENSLVVNQAFLKSKGPRLFDALAKVDVMLTQVKSNS